MKNNKSILNILNWDLQKIFVASIVLDILFLIFGIFAYINPVMTQKSVAIVLGVYFLLFGLFNIYEFVMRKGFSLFKERIILGILEIGVGIFAFFCPLKIVKMLTILLGIYLIFIAIFKILDALILKKHKYDGWLIVLVISIMLLIFGVFNIINPLVASIDIVEIVSIFIILASILEITYHLILFGKYKELKKLFKD